MLLETGRVVSAENRHAIVEVEKGAECTRCHAGCACSFGDKTVMVKAEDRVGVKKDQIVSLEIPEGNVLMAAFMVYIVPLVLLIVGILTGDYLGKRLGVDLWFEVFGGIAGIGLSVPIIRYYDMTFKRHLKQQPKIVKIISNANQQRQKVLGNV